MADSHRACRQLERMLPPPQNPGEPPDDRKTFADMVRYPKKQTPIPSEKWQLIGTFIYNPNKQTVRFERAGESVNN